MFENPRRGRQAKNFTTNAPKILDLTYFPENYRWVPLINHNGHNEQNSGQPETRIMKGAL